MSAPTLRPTDATVGGSSAARSGAHSPAVVLLGWLAARVLIGVVYLSLQFSTRPLAWGDLALYEFWAAEIARTGAMPDNVTWMYPPLAAFVLLLADVPPGQYGTSFVVLMLAADLAVLLLLLSAHRRGGAHPAGMWAWVVLVPLLGTISWSRLDLVPVAFAAAALLLAPRRPLLAGVMAGLGTAAKGWPVVLGLLFLRERRWLAGAVAAGLLVALASTLLLGGSWTFLRHLSGRGIQVESPMAFPWTLQQALGTPVDGDFVNGTYEVLEPGAATLARVATLVMLVTVGGGLWLSRRRAPALRWYVAIMGLLATSPLLSTQFVLWLIGGVAVAAAVPGPDGRVARRSLPAVAVLVVLTHLVFPVQWFGLVTDGALPAATLLARNGLLLALTAWVYVSARGSSAPEAAADPGLAERARSGTSLATVLPGPAPDGSDDDARGKSRPAPAEADREVLPEGRTAAS